MRNQSTIKVCLNIKEIKHHQSIIKLLQNCTLAFPGGPSTGTTKLHYTLMHVEELIGMYGLHHLKRLRGLLEMLLCTP